MIDFGAAATAELERLEDQEGERERLRAAESDLREALVAAAALLTAARDAAAKRLATRRQCRAAAAGPSGRRVRRDAGAGRGRTIRRGSRHLHVRPEPRRAAAAARPDRVGRRGQPPLARPEGRAGGGRRDAAAHLRRGRCRRRRTQRRRGRGAAEGAQRSSPGPVRHPSGPGRGPRRRARRRRKAHDVDGRTVTEARELAPEERAVELAAMLAGEGAGDEAHAAAEALLRAAAG